MRGEPYEDRNRQSIAPTSDHVARFWRLLEDNEVRLIVEMKRTVGGADSPDGPIDYCDVSSFSDDVAKALLREREQK